MHDIVHVQGFDDAIVGDLLDVHGLAEAAEGMDALVHLGGDPGSSDGSWQSILNKNIIGTYNAFEACRKSGVKRVAYASRAGLLGGYDADDPATFKTVGLPITPVGDYTVSKAFGEALAYSYVQQHQMEIVCVRIGNYTGDRIESGDNAVIHPHQLSPGDCVRCFEAAITHPGVTYEVVFGVSDSTWPLYDIDHGRRAIGYYPQDKSVVERPVPKL